MFSTQQCSAQVFHTTVFYTAAFHTTVFCTKLFRTRVFYTSVLYNSVAYKIDPHNIVLYSTLYSVPYSIHIANSIKDRKVTVLPCSMMIKQTYSTTVKIVYIYHLVEAERLWYPGMPSLANTLQQKPAKTSHCEWNVTKNLLSATTSTAYWLKVYCVRRHQQQVWLRHSCVQPSSTAFRLRFYCVWHNYLFLRPSNVRGKEHIVFCTFNPAAAMHGDGSMVMSPSSEG